MNRYSWEKWFEWEMILPFLAGMLVFWLWDRFLWPYRHQVYAWVFQTRRDDRIGDVVATDLELNRKGYALGYSYKRKAPLWVSYIISRASKNIDWDRTEHFEADLDIPTAYRVDPSDYTRSGYDKGHLAPSSAIDFSKRSNQETFLMSNVVPQHPQLNRQAWRSLENQVQNWVQERGRLMVVTGPLFAPRNKRVNELTIPNSFYKIVYSPKHMRAIGFLFPNEPVKASSLWDHVFSVSELEEMTGYTFLNKLSSRKQRLAKQLDLNWWQMEWETD